MTEYPIRMAWFNPPALTIGLLVMCASAARHIYLFQKGRVGHSHNEQHWFAALVSIALFSVWLASTFYVFALDGIFMAAFNLLWYSAISFIVTWQLGRSMVAIYTIRVWQRANPRRFPDESQKSA